MVKLIPIADGVLLEFKNEQIRIEVTRLREDRSGDLKGELSVKSLETGYTRHLHQARFNFSSTRTRRELAKTLSESHEADWNSILERLCLDVINFFRQGEPVIELLPGEAQPPEYLIEPLLIKGYPTVIFGDPGSTKSTVAMILAVLVTLPWRDNPLQLEPSASSLKVLYLDYETDRQTVAWQLKRFLKGMELPMISFFYRHCFLRIVQDVNAVRRAIRDNAIDLLMIDSLGLACGGDLKEPGPATEFFSALRGFNVSSLILAHTSKNPDQPKKRSIFGSVFFEAQSRSIWEIVKRQEAGEDDLDIALYHRKAPPFSKLHSPIGFKLSFTNDTMRIDYQEPKSVGEFLERYSAGTRIRELLLKEGALSPKDISERLDLAPANTRQALSRLKQKTQVVKIGDKWGVPAPSFLAENG